MMTELMKTLSNPAWWVSVWGVGILVNLASSYLKPQLDRILAGLSASRAARGAQAKEQRAARVAKLRASDRALFLAVREEHGYWLWTAILYAGAALSMVAATTDYSVLTTLTAILKLILYLLSIAGMILGMHSLRRGAAQRSEINEALREPTP